MKPPRKNIQGLTSPMAPRMKNTLRFWVEAESEDTDEQNPARTRSQRIAKILREYEKAGEAMRYLNAAGRIAWKATPKMLTRLANAEREVEDDLADD
jgi:hypothetical protein